MVWLHGTLHVSVLEARNLPDDDNLGLDLAGKVRGGKKPGMFSSALKSVEKAAGDSCSCQTRPPEPLQCPLSMITHGS